MHDLPSIPVRHHILSINSRCHYKEEQLNFMGVTLDKYINCKPYTNKLALKLSKYSGILNKLNCYLLQIKAPLKYVT